MSPRMSETVRREAWIARRITDRDSLARAGEVLQDLRGGCSLHQAQLRHPARDGQLIPKSVLIQAYRSLVLEGEWDESPEILRRIRMKPVRTLSGVAVVTVLTRPYPCPGDCVFCPSEPRMPKSYLSDEPGAMRAVQHGFDPFGQTASRLEALRAIGHPVDKVDLLILGGTWSAYPSDYQDWFLQRCLEACNNQAADSLGAAQRENELAPARIVGLVIETRPDEIDRQEVTRLRRLGVTKVQLGVQSLDDSLLQRNRRGHTSDDTRRAMALLRAAGFKIAVHWMPNLLGATLEMDHLDFARLWNDEALRPDELKIYPCQLLRDTDLYLAWERGEYTPYSQETLLDLLADLKPTIPEYCRVNRVLRDIPAHHVVAGNTRSSLRQDVLAELERRGQRCRCIRCREIREEPFESAQLSLRELHYSAGGAQEDFLSLTTPDDRLAGYARLSLPGPGSPDTELPDLHQAALLRELHVFGQSLEVGVSEPGAAQHIGLGARLLEAAELRAGLAGFRRMAVIAALGTRGYYRRLGYSLGDTYMTKDLADDSTR
jgi:elongator complex protein 3